MIKKEFDVIDIDWEGPFPVIYDRDNDKYIFIDSVPDAILSSTGIYQIYGRHPVYGKNVLLYIGETKAGDSNRSFKDRMAEHFNERGRFFGHTNLSVHFGPLDVSDDTLVKVESILIFSHAPALNRKHIDKPSAGADTMLVRNWSFVGSLESTCTGFWGE
tara:strand:- start:4 stop:483 length:480 start_codon:yes stop_codon:yes gene_type:complete